MGSGDERQGTRKQTLAVEPGQVQIAQLRRSPTAEASVRHAGDQPVQLHPLPDIVAYSEKSGV